MIVVHQTLMVQVPTTLINSTYKRKAVDFSTQAQQTESMFPFSTDIGDWRKQALTLGKQAKPIKDAVYLFI